MLINTSCLSQRKRFAKWSVENAKKCIKEALDSLKTRRKKRKIKIKEKQESVDFGVK